MSVTEPEFPPTATELDALVERIDELDEIDELVDWQLNRPEFVRRRNEIDRCEDLVGVVPALRDEGSFDAEPAVLVVEAGPGQRVSVSVASVEYGVMLLVLDRDGALALADYLAQAAARHANRCSRMSALDGADA